MNLLEFLQALPYILGPVLATLFGLITIDLALGLAIAVRQKVFQWVRVTDFYRTNVLPYGIIALGVAGASQFIVVEVLPGDLANDLASLGTLLGVGPMFAHLILGSILPNVQALVLGKFKWQIVNPEWDVPAEISLGPGESAVVPVGSTVSIVEPDIEALNADGTAVDSYDPETLNHVGSESVPPDSPKESSGVGV